MRPHTARGGALVIAVLWLAGCQTLGDVIWAHDHGEGTVHVYPVDTDQAWQIALTVLRWAGSAAIEEQRDQGYMLARRGPTPLTLGAVMGVWVEPAGQGQTKVTVVTKRRFAGDITTPLTERTFQKRFAQAVALVKAGQPLPPTLPR
jgi:hypothetical protein